MKSTAEGLYEFWSGFNIPAYPEYAVPDDAQLPYITYELVQPNWRDSSPYYARVWYRDTSFVAITEKVDEIKNAVGEGARIPLDNGYMFIFKDTNFAQFQPWEAPDEHIKIAYLQFILHVLA